MKSLSKRTDEFRWLLEHAGNAIIKATGTETVPAIAISIGGILQMPTTTRDSTTATATSTTTAAKKCKRPLNSEFVDVVNDGRGKKKKRKKESLERSGVWRNGRENKGGKKDKKEKSKGTCVEEKKRGEKKERNAVCGG